MTPLPSQLTAGDSLYLTATLVDSAGQPLPGAITSVTLSPSGTTLHAGDTLGVSV